MAILKVPNECTSITTSISGVLTPVNSRVTLTDANEFTDISQGYNSPKVVSSNLATGAVIVQMSTYITSISMNGNAYAVTAGISAPMLAVDATQLIYEDFNFGDDA